MTLMIINLAEDGPVVYGRFADSLSSEDINALSLSTCVRGPSCVVLDLDYLVFNLCEFVTHALLNVCVCMCAFYFCMFMEVCMNGYVRMCVTVSVYKVVSLFCVQGWKCEHGV